MRRPLIASSARPSRLLKRPGLKVIWATKDVLWESAAGHRSVAVAAWLRGSRFGSGVESSSSYFEACRLERKKDLSSSPHGPLRTPLTTGMR